MPAARDRPRRPAGRLDVGGEPESLLVEPGFDRDDMWERERAQEVGSGAVVESSHEPGAAGIDVGAHDLERGAAQVAVNREPVGIRRQFDAGEVYVAAAGAIAPTAEPGPPRVHERNCGHPPLPELGERAWPGDELVAAVA